MERQIQEVGMEWPWAINLFFFYFYFFPKSKPYANQDCLFLTCKLQLLSFSVVQLG